MTYRAYASDNVVEIVEDSNARCGFAGVNVSVVSHPEAVMDENGLQISPPGSFVLKSLPDESSIILPAPFIQGSRRQLESVVNRICAESRYAEDVREQWRTFRDICPLTDDSNQYCLEKGLHIPFKEELFYGVVLSNKSPIEPRPIVRMRAPVKAAGVMIIKNGRNHQVSNKTRVSNSNHSTADASDLNTFVANVDELAKNNEGIFSTRLQLFSFFFSHRKSRFFKCSWSCFHQT